jgi:hypothetical protein
VNATLTGSEVPRIWTKPLRDLTPQTSKGYEAIWFAENVLCLQLFPWQRWLFIHLLELREDGGFRFRTALTLVARQNGKSTFLQILSLWALYVERVGMVIGTAQNLDIAEECWQGAVDMAEGVQELHAEIMSVDMTNGKRQLKLRGGPRYKVQAASRRGSRGLSADIVLLDELREHRAWDAWAAITKTTMARPNALILAASNAGEDSSVVLNDLRSRAVTALSDPLSNPSLAIFEWSAEDGCNLDDRQGWVSSNPSLGHGTLTEEAIVSAISTDPPHVVRTEVLCQRVSVGVDAPLPDWPARQDVESRPDVGWPVAFAVDVSWNRSNAWIAAALQRPDGIYHVEVMAQGLGVEWVTDWIAERIPVWKPVAVCVQGSGAPAASLVDELTEALGTALVRPMSQVDVSKAAAKLYDGTKEGFIVHPGQQQLDAPAGGAAIRPMSDMWQFDRRKSQMDVAPLVAVSEALWAITGWKEPPPRRAPSRLR